MGTVAHTCNSGNLVAEAVGVSRVLAQFGLQRETMFQRQTDVVLCDGKYGSTIFIDPINMVKIFRNMGIGGPRPCACMHTVDAVL